MSKIGILTHHYVFNYGALLQAYAQSQMLNAKIIDYRLKNTVDGQSNNLRSKMFLEFINNKLPLSEKQLISMDYSVGLDLIKDYEKVVVGSDEIWKLGANPTYRKPYPNIYWLSPDLKCKKIAMAASANRLNYKNTDLNTLKDMENKLSAFDFIGVRDNHTLNFVKSMGLKVEKIPDPTIAYEFDKIDLDINKYNKKKLGIRLFTNTMNTLYFKELLKVFKDYSIYGISIKNSYANYNLDYLIPFEWVNSFRYFDFVITDSYHCLIFSLKNGVPALIIDSNEYKNMESKTYDLLRDLDMLYCHVNIWEANNPVEKIKYIKDNFNKNKVVEKLNKMKQKYLEFAEVVKRL